MKTQSRSMKTQPWFFAFAAVGLLLVSPTVLAQEATVEGSTVTEPAQPALSPRDRIKDRVQDRREATRDRRQNRRQQRRENARERVKDMTPEQRQALGQRYRRWRNLNSQQKRRVWNSLNPKEKRALRRYHATHNPNRRFDFDNNPPGPRGGRGTNWENPPGPRGGPGTSPDRRPWRRQVDRDNNPPGPVGGRGTNWENPPGPRGGRGASPDRRRWSVSPGIGSQRFGRSSRRSNRGGRRR